MTPGTKLGPYDRAQLAQQEASMTKWILAVALILMAFPSSGIAQTKESLVGTWKLVSHTNTNDKGEVQHYKDMGFLTYTADGRISVIMADTGRAATPPQSIEEKAKAFDTFGAYGGTYTLSGAEVTHHIEVASYEILVGTAQVRSVKLEGDRLTLRGGWLVNGVMYDANTELVWERMKPETADTKK
jgi:hypothetical protein